MIPSEWRRHTRDPLHRRTKDETQAWDYSGMVGADSTLPLYCREHGSVVRTRAGCCPQCVEEAAADVAAHEERSDLRDYRQSLIDQRWRG